MGSLSLLAGIRFVQFNDAFLATGDADRGPEVLPFRLPYLAHNRLVGVQGGLQGALWTSNSGAVEIEGWAKLGLMGNAMHLSASYAETDPKFSAVGRDAQVAMLGDVGLAANWVVSPHFKIRLGYQLLSNITAVDYLTDGVIELLYHFYHLDGGPPIVVKVRVACEQSVVPSLTKL